MTKTEITFIPEAERKTKRPIVYAAFGGQKFTIPAGTKYIPADNIPEDNAAGIKWWAEEWPRMSNEAKSHSRTYGFGLTDEEVN